MPKPKNTRLSVFKGREARLNRAIFQTLALKGPQTIYDVYKEMRRQKRLKNTRYSSINKRMRTLEKSGYLNKAAVIGTKSGFESSIYELAARAYLAMLLDSIDLEKLILKADEQVAQTVLASLLNAL